MHARGSGIHLYRMAWKAGQISLAIPAAGREPKSEDEELITKEVEITVRPVPLIPYMGDCLVGREVPTMPAPKDAS
jgi:hypothetical protein